ncbi:MAG: DUF2764 family protein [Ruminococcaceae bacterium]|nr:DUF2764 family protein [Oscillospiraceae bacterium]
MAEYYLVSQLPSLDAVGENTPLPITEERFLELCNQHLVKKAQKEIQQMTLVPPINLEVANSALINAWNESERNLRLALGKVRAEKMNKPFNVGNVILPVEYMRAASTAAEMENPMEAEEYLNRYRLSILEALRPMDIFSEEYILYYGIKLKLLLRKRLFDTQSGETAYKNIYNSILNGDRLEAKQ